MALASTFSWCPRQKPARCSSNSTNPHLISTEQPGNAGVRSRPPPCLRQGKQMGAREGPAETGGVKTPAPDHLAFTASHARIVSATLQDCAIEPPGRNGGSPSKISPMLPRPPLLMLL